MKKMKHVLAMAMHQTPGFKFTMSFRAVAGRAHLENPERWEERTFPEILTEAILDHDLTRKILRDGRFQASEETLVQWSKGQNLPTPTVQTYIWWTILEHEIKK